MVSVGKGASGGGCYNGYFPRWAVLTEFSSAVCVLGWLRPAAVLKHDSLLRKVQGVVLVPIAGTVAATLADIVLNLCCAMLCCAVLCMSLQASTCSTCWSSTSPHTRDSSSQGEQQTLFKR